MSQAMRVVIAVWLLVGCASGRGRDDTPAPDRQLELLTHAGRTAFTAGDARQAAMLYAQALDRAYLRADPQEVALAIFDLAAAQARLRHYDQALATLATAEALDPPLPHAAERHLLRAQMLYEQRHIAEAGEALNAAEHLGLTSTVIETYRGLIAADRGDLASAHQSLQRLPLTTDGLRLRLEGRIAEREGRFADAAGFFEREAEAHRDRSNFAAMAEALARAGESWELAEMPARAASMFLAAGRSAALQTSDLPAAQWLERARSIAAGTHPAVATEAEQWLIRTRPSPP